jgi:hypothetical protein
MQKYSARYGSRCERSHTCHAREVENLWVFPEELEMESLASATIVGCVAASIPLEMTKD